MARNASTLSGTKLDEKKGVKAVVRPPGDPSRAQVQMTRTSGRQLLNQHRDKASAEKAKDAPAGTKKHAKPMPKDYKLCSAVLNDAWKKEKESHCGYDAHMAVLRVRDNAETCSKLRWGEDYYASYRALLEQVDTWCGKPTCSTCVHGRCARDKTFPHEAKCQCAPGWGGHSCNSTACSPACVHGTCVGEGKCMCHNGWEGASCSKPICNPGCLNGGTCVGPNTCECKKGWKTVGLDAGCSAPVCDPPCANGAKCVAPNVCKCPDRKGTNGTTMEGFSGPQCEHGPSFWFGDQCKDCVNLKGHWCLKDGICVKPVSPCNSASCGAPTKEICPNSMKQQFDGFTPTVIFGSEDPCKPEYRRCAEVAEPVIHWVNHDDRLLGGVCGGAVKGLIKEMADELPRCEGIMITKMEQDLGTLNVTEKFGIILNQAVAKHKKECPSDKAN